MIVGVAKLNGDLSAEQKKVALNQFKSNFSLDTSAASELLGSAAHLLGAPQVIDTQLDGVAEKNKGQFTKDQAESMIGMMMDVASAEGDLTEKQSEYVERMRSLFVPVEKGQGTWS